MTASMKLACAFLLLAPVFLLLWLGGMLWGFIADIVGMED